jgi:NAD+ diphosphatase
MAASSHLSSPPAFVPCLHPPAGADIDHANERWFYVRGDDVLVCDGPAELPLRGQHFLGMLAERPCWAGDVEPPESGERDADDGSFIALRALWGRLSEVEWTVAGLAVQLVEWDRTHRFCGRCGNETGLSSAERSRRCPHCGLTAFPRLAPAIIVLIERDGPDGPEALLARGRQFPIPMYSCLAGFVEPGETLEGAVHREVREEVGVEIDEVHYVASQPWPFPHSLMLGFTARWASGHLVLDETEIADANWYRPDDLPMIPPGMSIARRLIDAWVERATG